MTDPKLILSDINYRPKFRLPVNSESYYNIPSGAPLSGGNLVVSAFIKTSDLLDNTIKFEVFRPFITFMVEIKLIYFSVFIRPQGAWLRTPFLNLFSLSPLSQGKKSNDS